MEAMVIETNLLVLLMQG